MLKTNMNKRVSIYMRKELFDLLKEIEQQTGLSRSKLISFAVLNLYLIFRENYQLIDAIMKMWETIIEKLPEKILTIQGKP